MTIDLQPTDIYLTIGEVCAYVKRTPQAVSAHRRVGHLIVTDRRVRLDHFIKYLARRYPKLKRPTIEELDAWREEQRKEKGGEA